MSNDKTNLAGVQPGGRVRLGDQAERARFEAWPHAREFEIQKDGSGEYLSEVTHGAWLAWKYLSAQPSPGGQDALAALQQDYDKLLDSFDRQVEVAEKIAGRVLQQDDRIEELEEALAARQPVGQIDEAAVLRRAADVLYMWEDDPNLTGHMGDFKDACDILEVLAQNAAQPAQAVDADGFWLAVDEDGFVHFGQSIDDGNGGVGVRENVESRINDWLDNDGRSVDLVWAGSASAQAVDLGTGVKAIAAERERQLHAEGFTRDGDQQYRRGELARAATAYVQLAAMDLEAGTRNHIAWREPASVWPWAPEWWKPVDARRDLVRAGALIAAQIDAIDSQAVGNG